MTAINGHIDPGTVPPSKRQALTPDEMRLKTRELRIANRYRREAMEATLLESYFPGNDYAAFGGSDTWEQFFMGREGNAAGWAPPSQPSDRRGGAKWPLWRTDVELNRHRQASRILCASNDYAKGLLKNMTNSVIGKGLSYKLGSNESPAAVKYTGMEELAAGAQAHIGTFCERNNWNTSAEPEEEDDDGAVPAGCSTREREAFWRVPRDGETMLRLFYRPDGHVDVRFIGPELVWGIPPGKSEADGWSYGMQHRVTEEGEDTERIVAYYVRSKDVSHAPANGKQDTLGGEIVPAREIIHIKDPFEDAEVKRGTPAFCFDTLDALTRAAKLQRNISVSAAVRAATAEVWKHSVGTQSQIQNLQNAQPGTRTVPVGDGYGGGTRTEQRIYPGMIRRTPQGQEPVPFPTTTNVPDHQMAAQGDLRQACAAFCAPEYMTGTTNEANFATASEAGTPWVRAAESDQEHYKLAFVRMMWRVLRWAVERKLLPRETLTMLAITAEGMQVHKNNEGELSAARTANLANKVTSPQIECMKLGNDPKKVAADWMEWRKLMGEPELGMVQTLNADQKPVPPQEPSPAAVRKPGGTAKE